MLSIKKIYWLAQAIGWLLYVIVVGIYNVITGNVINSDLIYGLLAIYLIGIFVSHLFRLIIIKLNWIKYAILYLTPRILLGALFSGILVSFLRSMIIEQVIIDNNYEFNLVDTFTDIISWTLLFLIWSLIYFLFHFITNYKKEEIKNLQWQATKNEIELNKLKSQLNPHFIFNSMNSIRALINDEPKLAKEAITQLSNVLRNSLLMGRKKLISLSEEMRMVNDYLGLEKTRFEERLIIKRNITESTNSFLIPPLMLQTLVENGIKHGTSKLPEGGIIEIHTSMQNEKLKVVIYNSGTYDNTIKPKTGFGIVNTVQRLKILYGERAVFNITNEKNRVKTVLLIPNETIL